jgi:hypothetical protein
VRHSLTHRIQRVGGRDQGGEAGPEFAHHRTQQGVGGGAEDLGLGRVHAPQGVDRVLLTQDNAFPELDGLRGRRADRQGVARIAGGERIGPTPFDMRIPIHRQIARATRQRILDTVAQLQVVHLRHPLGDGELVQEIGLELVLRIGGFPAEDRLQIGQREASPIAPDSFGDLREIFQLAAILGELFAHDVFLCEADVLIGGILAVDAIPFLHRFEHPAEDAGIS